MSEPIRSVANLIDPRLRTKPGCAIVIDETTHDGDLWQVWSDFYNQWGAGPTETQAITDLQETIADLYWILKCIAAEGRLGPWPLTLWQRMQDTIEERKP